MDKNAKNEGFGGFEHRNAEDARQSDRKTYFKQLYSKEKEQKINQDEIFFDYSDSQKNDEASKKSKTFPIKIRDFIQSTFNNMFQCHFGSEYITYLLHLPGYKPDQNIEKIKLEILCENENFASVIVYDSDNEASFILKLLKVKVRRRDALREAKNLIKSNKAISLVSFSTIRKLNLASKNIFKRFLHVFDKHECRSKIKIRYDSNKTSESIAKELHRELKSSIKQAHKSLLSKSDPKTKAEEFLENAIKMSKFTKLDIEDIKSRIRDVLKEDTDQFLFENDHLLLAIKQNNKQIIEPSQKNTNIIVEKYKISWQETKWTQQLIVLNKDIEPSGHLFVDSSWWNQSKVMITTFFQIKFQHKLERNRYHIAAAFVTYNSFGSEVPECSEFYNAMLAKIRPKFPELNTVTIDFAAALIKFANDNNLAKTGCHFHYKKAILMHFRKNNQTTESFRAMAILYPFLIEEFLGLEELIINVHDKEAFRYITTTFPPNVFVYGSIISKNDQDEFLKLTNNVAERGFKEIKRQLKRDNSRSPESIINTIGNYMTWQNNITHNKKHLVGGIKHNKCKTHRTALAAKAKFEKLVAGYMVGRDADQMNKHPTRLLTFQPFMITTQLKRIKPSLIDVTKSNEVATETQTQPTIDYSTPNDDTKQNQLVQKTRTSPKGSIENSIYDFSINDLPNVKSEPTHKGKNVTVKEHPKTEFNDQIDTRETEQMIEIKLLENELVIERKAREEAEANARAYALEIENLKAQLIAQVSLKEQR